MPHLRTVVYWLANSAALLWLLLALLTVGGIALSTIGWVINLVMSVVFALIAAFFRLRGQSLKPLLTALDLRQINRFLQTEILLLLLANLFAAILLSAALSRILGERLPVFG